MADSECSSHTKVNTMDLSRGYEIKPASEGGFVVFCTDQTAPGYARGVIAAFSNASDLIVWLAGQHEVTLYGRVVHSQSPETSGPISIDDGWRTWRGGDRAPLERGVGVEVRHRDGSTYRARVYEAQASRWKHDGSDSDIVAYRPVNADDTHNARMAV